MCFSLYCSVWPGVTCVWLVNINPRTQPRYKHIKLWWSCYDKNIFPISFPFLFWTKTISMMFDFGNNQNMHYWEGKSDFPKLCVPQKYGDLYVSPIQLSTLMFCMYMQLLFYKLWFPPHLKTTLVGNILSHIFPFSNLFENN